MKKNKSFAKQYAEFNSNWVQNFITWRHTYGTKTLILGHIVFDLLAIVFVTYHFLERPNFITFCISVHLIIIMFEIIRERNIDLKLENEKIQKKT